MYLPKRNDHLFMTRHIIITEKKGIYTCMLTCIYIYSYIFIYIYLLGIKIFMTCHMVDLYDTLVCDMCRATSYQGVCCTRGTIQQFRYKASHISTTLFCVQKKALRINKTPFALSLLQDLEGEHGEKKNFGALRRRSSSDTKASHRQSYDTLFCTTKTYQHRPTRYQI